MIRDELPVPANEIPIRFDRDNPAKVTSLDVAEEMMMAWYARNRSQWGYWHAAALTGAEPAKGAPKKRPEGGAGRG